jgi:tetratricopeptide (TPR) repeat protein
VNLLAHPEAALDRALAGTLPDEQRRELDLHLSACAACAAHLAAAERTRQRLAPQPWDEHLDRQAVENAMTGLYQPRSSRLRLAGALRLGFALAGLLLIVGVAGAALWRSQRLSAHPVSVPVFQPARLPEPPGSARVVAADPNQPQPRLVAERVVAKIDQSSVEPATPRPPRAQSSAAALFAQALALRAEGKVDAAIAAHLRLQRFFPAARETRLSFALAGRLLLEKRSSEQALAQFNQYLARPGDVAEEALVGRATALGNLGRAAAEAAAWREVLDHNPESIYAAHAKKRLSALAEKPTLAPEPRR